MQRFDLKSGTIRAVITFILAFALLKLLLWILDEIVGLDFFAKDILILIGAGWLAYWVWKKTELGYY